MNRDFNRLGQPLRSFRARRAAALLAGLGAAIVQLGWLEVFAPRTTASRAASACLLVAATVYLISSLWFHAASPQVRRRRGVNRRGELGRGLTCDVVVGGAVLAALCRGHDSGVLRLGLWILPPTLLAFSAVSAAVTFLAWRDVFVRFPAGDRLPNARIAQSRLGWARVASALCLLIALAAVELALSV